MKRDGVEVIRTVGYLVSSLEGEARVGIIRQLWSEDSIRFDLDDTTAIVRRDGRLLLLDHVKQHATWLRAKDLGSVRGWNGLIVASTDTTLSALRSWLREQGVSLSNSPMRSYTTYLGIPCTISIYHDERKEPLLWLYLPRRRSGPGILKVALVVQRLRTVFAWDTVSYATVKLPASVFDIPTGYTVTGER